jgi:hypothetical protein
MGYTVADLPTRQLREDLRLSRAESAAAREEAGTMNRRIMELETAMHGKESELTAAAAAATKARAEREREQEMERARKLKADAEQALAAEEKLRLTEEAKGVMKQMKSRKLSILEKDLNQFESVGSNNTELHSCPSISRISTSS